MGFRRRKPNHGEQRHRKQWLADHAATLLDIGVAPEVLRDPEHWDEFLEMGSLDRFEPSTGWSFEALTEAQMNRLRAFLQEHCHPEPPLLGWLRTRLEDAAR